MSLTMQASQSNDDHTRRDLSLDLQCILFPLFHHACYHLSDLYVQIYNLCTCLSTRRAYRMIIARVAFIFTAALFVYLKRLYMQSTCLLCRFSQLDLMLDYSINLLVIFPPGYLEIFSGSISLTYIPNCISFF